MNIPNRLIRSFKAGDVTIFVGAGISCQAGLPSWTTTIEKVKTTLLEKARVTRSIGVEREFIKGADYLQIIERFKKVSTSEEYNSFLLEQFHTTAQPSEAHKLIAKLPSKLIVTTNFDTLLESAIRDECGYLPLTCTDYQKMVRAASQEKKYVIKLHGCINDINTIVFSESDYRNFSVAQKALLDYLRTQLDTGVVLFIGYSLTDPDINKIINDSLVFTQGSKRDDFVVFKGLNPILKENWKSKGLITIDIKDFNEIQMVLSQIHALINAPALCENTYVEHPLLEKDIIVLSKAKYQSCETFGLNKCTSIVSGFVRRVLRGNRATFIVPSEVSDLVSLSNKIMIFGEPGSGKSFLMNYLAYYFSHLDGDGCSVIKIPLGEVNGEQIDYDFLQRIVEYISTNFNLNYVEISNFKAMLKKRKVVLLLDGLDEILYTKREHIFRTINDLQREFPLLSVIISSRYIDTTEWDGFEKLTLENMSYEDAIELLECWFTEYCGVDSDEAKERAKEIIKMNPCFSANALLTAAVCRVAVEDKSSKSTRTSVFRRIISWSLIIIEGHLRP